MGGYKFRYRSAGAAPNRPGWEGAPHSFGQCGLHFPLGRVVYVVL